jgi:hypothetical protein
MPHSPCERKHALAPTIGHCVIPNWSHVQLVETVIVVMTLVAHLVDIILGGTI